MTFVVADLVRISMHQAKESGTHLAAGVVTEAGGGVSWPSTAA